MTEKRLSPFRIPSPFPPLVAVNMVIRSLLLLLYLAIWSAAQDLFIPAGWRKPTFTQLRDARIQLAQKSVGLVVQNVSNSAVLNGAMGSLQIANLIASVALGDYLSGSTQQQALVSKTLSSMAANPGFASGTWVLACIYAYRAYQDPAMLKLAENAWTSNAVWQITEADAQAGTHPLRSFPLSSCNNQTMAGGVFYVNNDRNDSTIDFVGVGMLMVAASHLAETTSNQTYLNAAVLSATFARNFFLTPSNLMSSQIDVHTCQSNTTVVLRNSGIAAHAWSVIADQTGDADWRNLSANIVVASTQANQWAGSDGILFSSGNNGPDFKGSYIRDLYEPWIRSVLNNDTSMSTYIGAYMAVQYNALQDLALDSASGYYSSDWHGPPVNYWTTDGVEDSVGLLVAAIAPHNYNQTAIGSTAPPTSSGSSSSASLPTSSGSSTSSSDPASTAKTAHKHSSAAVAGGTVAAVVCAILVLILLLAIRRSHRSRRDIKSDLLSAEVDGRWEDGASDMNQQHHEMESVPGAAFGGSAVPSHMASPSAARLVQVVTQTHVYEVQPGEEPGHGELPPYAEAPVDPVTETSAGEQSRTALGRKGTPRS